MNENEEEHTKALHCILGGVWGPRPRRRAKGIFIFSLIDSVMPCHAVESI